MKHSDEEMAQINIDACAWIEKLNKVLKDEFDEFELFLLKCHLLIEHELNKYIEIRTKGRLSMEKAGFSFKNKIKIAKMLGCFEDNGKFSSFEEFLEKLNIIRNQIAHRFSFDKNILNELILFCKKINPGIEIKKGDPKSGIIAYTISYFAGGLPQKAQVDLLMEVTFFLEGEKK